MIKESDLTEYINGAMSVKCLNNNAYFHNILSDNGEGMLSL